jgi:hypothetical protein
MPKNQETIDAIVFEILEDYVLECVNLFVSEIDTRKITATSALINSFQSDVIRNAGRIEAEIKFLFYGKFKDMASIGFKKTPPAQAIEDWINAKGPSTFKLPNAPTISAAVKKLVWTIMRAIQKSHTITNKKGKWKSTNDYMAIVGKYRSKIAREAGKLVAHYVAVTIGDERINF